MLGIPLFVTWLIYREKDIKNSTYFTSKLSTLVGGIRIFELEAKTPNVKSMAEVDINNKAESFNSSPEIFPKNTITDKD